MLRVMIDATPLLVRSAGIKTYTYEWIKALRETGGAESVRLFPFLTFPSGYDHERSPLTSFATKLRLLALHLGNLPGNPAWNLLGRDVDIFHCSNQCRNPPRNALLTATVFDLTCALLPEVHFRANVNADAIYAERVLKRSQGLIAISEHTRRDAIEVLRIPPDRITTIYPGVASRFFDVPAEEIARSRITLGLRKPYVLSVGTIEPRKNIDRLLAAWLALPGSLREEFDLLFAGPIGWASESTKSALKQGRDGIRYLGYVAESDLAGLNAGAAVLAYPSLYEGFGLPVAQAMASGVAVMTSNISSLPEVAGEGAEYADPRSVESIGEALKKLLESGQLRSEKGRLGRLRAEKFRWETCARQTWEFWESLSRGGR